MTQLISNIWETLKALANMYIIWIIGPDGQLFDLMSTIKILVSGGAILAMLIKVMWKTSKNM